ncbi:MAG: CCA tRNA nucleotidyltransferase [Patescibacteria group bacterium]|nr:CCA tRNA nucleotidyltransferase [Patescibacteria group bacterium]
MTRSIPDNILKVYKKLHNASFEAYFVGGCVRSIILKKDVKDWDLAANAAPEDILKLFPDGFYDNKFGTVGIPLADKRSLPAGRQVVEITTYRTEGEYKDSRHPESVKWGKTIEEDLARRDFTINAIALKITSFDKKTPDFEIIDPYEGQKDIEKKTVKAVGDANKRFKEDALRLIRAIRIATELNFTIEEDTWNKIKEDASLIQNISNERVHDELLRILKSDNAYEGIILLKDSTLLQFILPELIEGIDVSQIRPGRHHTTDVFTHNVLSLKFCPSKDPVVRFATLIHDVGKPKVEKKDEEGLVIFHNHEVVGAKIAKEICQRLKFSKKDTEKIVSLIRWHMFSVNEELTDAGVRRFIRRVGVGNVKDMMDLRVGDRLGGGTQTAESWRLKLFKEKVEKQLKPAPFSINDMAIDGNDIMSSLQIKPGPKVGEILQKLFEEVDEDLSKNNKNYLLKRITQLGKTLL